MPSFIFRGECSVVLEREKFIDPPKIYFQDSLLQLNYEFPPLKDLTSLTGDKFLEYVNLGKISDDTHRLYATSVDGYLSTTGLDAYGFMQGTPMLTLWQFIKLVKDHTVIVYLTEVL